MQINVQSDNGLIGNISQDVVTVPHRKNLEIIFENGYINIINNFEQNLDRIEYFINEKLQKIDFPKSRKDDFLGAIKNIERSFLENKNNEKSMDFNCAVETMFIIKSSLESNKLKKRVDVSYKYD